MLQIQLHPDSGLLCCRNARKPEYRVFPGLGGGGPLDWRSIGIGPSGCIPDYSGL